MSNKKWLGVGALVVGLLIFGFQFLTLNEEQPLWDTGSMIEVVNKEYSDDYKEAWIFAFDPYSSTKEEEIKIIIEEPMVWNLIEEGKTYSASYQQQDADTWVLMQISHEGDFDTLR